MTKINTERRMLVIRDWEWETKYVPIKGINLELIDKAGLEI